MSEELDVLRIVTDRLEAAGIGYMVTGAIAMNYHGVPRMTRDIDVVVELGAADTERVASLFHDEFYLEHDVVQKALEQGKPFSMIHVPLVVKVDFIPRKDTDYRKAEFGRRKKVTVEDQSFFLCAPEDLIISKLEWAKDSRSEVHFGDVRNLLRSAERLDGAYLDRWVGRLGMVALFREVAQ